MAGGFCIFSHLLDLCKALYVIVRFNGAFCCQTSLMMSKYTDGASHYPSLVADVCKYQNRLAHLSAPYMLHDVWVDCMLCTFSTLYSCVSTLPPLIKFPPPKKRLNHRLLSRAEQTSGVSHLAPVLHWWDWVISQRAPSSLNGGRERVISKHIYLPDGCSLKRLSSRHVPASCSFLSEAEWKSWWQPQLSGTAQDESGSLAL